MAFSSSPFKGALYVGMVLLLIGACGLLPAVADSQHGQGSRGNGAAAADGSPFNVDRDPCGPQGHRGGQRRGGNADCGDIEGPSAHGRGRAHPPGSNAFGLQFDYGN